MGKNRIIKRIFALTMVFIMLFQIQIPEQVYAATACLGEVESITASGTEVTIKGYAYDAIYLDSLFTEIYIEVGSSSKIYAGNANEINLSSPYVFHGFNCTVDVSMYLVSSGAKEIKVYAKSSSGDYTYLGSGLVLLNMGIGLTKTYTITYNANGGSSAPSSQTKTAGNAIWLTLSEPTRSGYRFLGWSTSSYASTPEYYGGGYYTKDEDLYLYAVWEEDLFVEETYTITYNENGGNSAPSSQTKNIGSGVYLTSSKPTRSGYKFLGWSTSSSATSPEYYGGEYYTKDEDLYLYAVWEKEVVINSSLKVGTTSISVNGNGTLDSRQFYVNTSGKFGFTVSVSEGTDWLAISKSSLYNADKGSASLSYTASKSNCNVYLAAKANDSNLSRTATITITSSDGTETANVTVTQSGMEGVLSISPESLTFAGGSSMSNFTVNSSNTGGFTVSVPSDNSWLRISKYYMSSTDDGFKELKYESSNYKSTVYVCADANTAETSRTATITIKHDVDPTMQKTITVTQSGMSFSVDKNSINFEEASDVTSSKIQITADSSIYWTAESSDSTWLMVSDYSSSYGYSSETGYGNGSLYVIASKNDKYEARSGTITISADGRSPIVINVTQAARVKGDISIDLDVDTLKLDANGKSNLVSSDSSYPAVKVDVTDSANYEVTTDGSDWIKVGTSGYSDSDGKKSLSTSNSSFYVYAKSNVSTESRTATITITADDGAVTKSLVVEQEGVVAQLTVSETSKTVEKDGTMYNNAVYVDTDGTGGIKISIPKDVDWLKLSSSSYSSFSSGMKELTFPSSTGGSYYYDYSTGTYETHDYCFYFVAKKNTSNKSRTASVTIINSLDSSVKETIKVTQDRAASTYLKLDRETAYFDEPKLECSAAIKVSTDDDTTWTAKASKSWIKIVKSKSTYVNRYSSIKETGKGTFYILVTENNSYSERTGYVTVSAPGLKTQKIYVSQVANEIDVKSLLEELTVTVTKKTFNIGNTSSIKFSYPDGLYASDIKKVTYSSNNKVVATVNSRGVIKAIKKGKATISVKVQLRKGATKTFKLRVVIGKRKVNISKL